MGLLNILLVLTVIFLQLMCLSAVNLLMKDVDEIYFMLEDMPGSALRYEKAEEDLFYYGENDEPDEEEVVRIKIMENIENFGTNKIQEDI
ncbi:MAG: hypothetical protein E7218_05135 [Anaerofustis stercorihominis]|nr:hypothetical protein [Anaerofustis stercorihominis]